VLFVALGTFYVSDAPSPLGAEVLDAEVFDGHLIVSTRIASHCVSSHLKLNLPPPVSHPRNCTPAATEALAYGGVPL
jgi:hypothetical protein